VLVLYREDRISRGNADIAADAKRAAGERSGARAAGGAAANKAA
jgi:hypothetical protein